MRRFHVLLVALSVALQAIDGVVGALGHSHGEATAAVEQRCDHHHHGGCSHHHDAGSPKRTAEPSRPAHPPDDHGDCSLCRHFSQPIVPVVVVLEIIGEQSIEPLVPSVVQQTIAPVHTAHFARGPPALSA